MVEATSQSTQPGGFLRVLVEPETGPYREAQQELDRLRARICIAYCALLYPAFYLLDLIVYPSLAPRFLGMRLAVAAVAMALFVADRLRAPVRMLRGACIALSSAATAGVSVMCAMADGFASIYLVGVIICFMALSTMEIFRPRLLGIAFVANSAFHFLINGLFDRAATTSTVVSTVFFLLGAALFCQVGAMLLEHQRRALFSAQQRLKEQNVMLDRAYRHQTEFLRTVTHELRSPLNTILGFTELIRERESTLSDKGTKNLDRIEGSARRLLSLINDILDLSKIEAGRLDVVIGELDVGGVIDEVAESARALIGAREVAVETDYPSSLRLRSDELRLRQILMNLAGNATKFTHRGQIRLSAVPDGDGVRFTVADTGVGIPEAALPELFRAFTQAHDRRAYGGTGLGLNIVKRLTELLGGSVHLESQEGKGTTVTVQLPNLPAPEANLAGHTHH